jgi:hypothetical protein
MQDLVGPALSTVVITEETIGTIADIIITIILGLTIPNHIRNTLNTVKCQLSHYMMVPIMGTLY